MPTEVSLTHESFASYPLPPTPGNLVSPIPQLSGCQSADEDDTAIDLSERVYGPIEYVSIDGH
jgi:hypothetical protein